MILSDLSFKLSSLICTNISKLRKKNEDNASLKMSSSFPNINAFHWPVFNRMKLKIFHVCRLPRRGSVRPCSRFHLTLSRYRSNSTFEYYFCDWYALALSRMRRVVVTNESILLLPFGSFPREILSHVSLDVSPPFVSSFRPYTKAKTNKWFRTIYRFNLFDKIVTVDSVMLFLYLNNTVSLFQKLFF